MITRARPWQVPLSVLQWVLIVGMIPAMQFQLFWVVGVLSLSNLAIGRIAAELRGRDGTQQELDSLRTVAKDYEQRMLLAETRAGVLEARNIVLERELAERTFALAYFHGLELPVKP